MNPDDLNRLVRPPPPEKRLDAASTPPAIRARTGLASTNRGEIASPLTETDRTHYAARDVTSSDGVFTISYTPVETISFTDANGKPVVLQFIDPA